MKRAIPILFLALLLLSCGKTGENKEADNSLRVGMVFDIGGKGDRSFNDSAWRGLEKACEDFGIRSVEFEPGQDSDREQGLRKLAERGFDLVIGVGFLFSDAIGKVAVDYPEVHFALVDGLVDGRENVASLLFREEEGSFLVGAIAARKSQSGVIGFVGGMEVALIRKFEAGFRAGAQFVRPEIRVLVNYAGVTPSSFADPVKGKELTLSQIGRGADVVFHAAGTTGNGVIEAASQKQVFAIGVDSNQNYMAPGIVLTSMEKKVDRAVYECISGLVRGEFRGGVQEFGLESGGVGYTLDEFNQSVLGPELCALADSLAGEIIGGRISVPRE
ncbi:MAG: BMP family ABC transporter substrate-binding protein [Candidatus Krumholzibacteria bacterium]|jgi:basic membrane protein A|nr:BMP family ABC transporter substrate-binding protein [Candidatus Krumholzibacteria bacterium]MDP7021277.1 BMP family ABC transporter substrate-binding protein [Candidatus Krumholzibacteria bacterium]